MNLTSISGNLGKDPEMRMTASGIKVATYSLAVTRKNAKDAENQVTDWFNIVAFGDQADLVADNLKKGMCVILLGKFQNRTYDDKEGKKVTLTEFWQDMFGIVPKKKSSEFTESSVNDDDLPF